MNSEWNFSKVFSIDLTPLLYTPKESN